MLQYRDIRVASDEIAIILEGFSVHNLLGRVPRSPGTARDTHLEWAGLAVRALGSPVRLLKRTAAPRRAT